MSAFADDPDTDALLAEITRLQAARETLENMQRACPAGIPGGLASLVAASVIVKSYDEARPLPSPFRTTI